MPRRRPAPAASTHSGAVPPTVLRIIGGRYRGRKLRYSGDRRVRPMKDRVREAVFNLLGPAVRGKHAFDLFAGTGALGLEALSRGAVRATFLEQHHPTAAVMRENAATLGASAECEVIVADTFRWIERFEAPGAVPWVVFCSPPYELFLSRRDAMLALVGRLMEQAPPESLFAVESDTRFDPALLPDPDAWDVRRYPPAVVAIYEKPHPPSAQ